MEKTLTSPQKHVLNKFVSEGLKGITGMEEIWDLALVIPHDILGDTDNLLMLKFMKRTSEISRKTFKEIHICLEPYEYDVLTDVVSSVKVVSKDHKGLKKDLKQEIKNADVVISKYKDKAHNMFMSQLTTGID